MKRRRKKTWSIFWRCSTAGRRRSFRLRTLAAKVAADYPAPLARTSPFLQQAGLQHAPFRNGNAALSAAAGKPGFIVDNFDDPARLLHHETQRHGGNAARFLAGVRPPASLRAPGADARLSNPFPATGRMAGGNHRLGRLFAAAQFRRARRIRRPAGHPQISRNPRPAAADASA